MEKKKFRIFFSISMMILIIFSLSIIIISYYSKEKILYFDVLSVDVIAILFSIYLIYDGFKNLNAGYISSLIKIAGGTAIFIIHFLEIIFIRILR